MEKQALRRVDEGDLSDEQIEDLGTGLMHLEQAMEELKSRYDLTSQDLNIDLGPLGPLSETENQGPAGRTATGTGRRRLRPGKGPIAATETQQCAHKLNLLARPEQRRRDIYPLLDHAGPRSGRPSLPSPRPPMPQLLMSGSTSRHVSEHVDHSARRALT